MTSEERDAKIQTVMNGIYLAEELERRTWESALRDAIGKLIDEAETAKAAAYIADRKHQQARNVVDDWKRCAKARATTNRKARKLAARLHAGLEALREERDALKAQLAEASREQTDYTKPPLNELAKKDKELAEAKGDTERQLWDLEAKLAASFLAQLAEANAKVAALVMSTESCHDCGEDGEGSHCKECAFSNLPSAACALLERLEKAEAKGAAVVEILANATGSENRKWDNAVFVLQNIITRCKAALSAPQPSRKGQTGEAVSEPKFTPTKPPPKPWRAVLDDDTEADPTWAVISTHKDKWPASYCPVAENITHEETAKLLARAPDLEAINADLYAALEAWMVYVEKGGDWVAAIGMTRAALAKARGETP